VKILCLLSLVAAFFNCSESFLTIPALESIHPKTQIPEDQWAAYGAYCLLDELFIEPSFDAYPINKIIIRKELKILSVKGAEFGTVSIPLLGNSIRQFDVRLEDATGASVPLDLKKLEKEYLKKGVVIVPNVTPGCRIGVTVAFITDGIIPYYEHYFSPHLPVALSKFTFSELDNFRYDFKDYNLDVKPVVEPRVSIDGNHHYFYHTYILKNVMPREEEKYFASGEGNGARVSIVLRRAFSQSVITSWADIAKKQEGCLFSSSPKNKKLYAILDSIKSRTRSEFQLADSLLQWTQENIILENSSIDKINPDRIIERQKGNIWEITGLLWEFYKSAGFSADVVLLRSKNEGGFDKDFITPASLEIPLIVVKTRESQLVAFPFNRGGRIGEYPTGFQGLDGLSLSRMTPVPLPASTSGVSTGMTRFFIDCAPERIRQTVDFILFGSRAYSCRVFLRSLDRAKWNEFFQNWLTGIGTSNALDTGFVEGIDQPGKPLIFHMKFSNPNQVITRGATEQINLSNLFDRYFSTYDTTRTADFVISYPYEDTEVVEIVPNDAKAAYNFSCNALNNKLFSCECLKSNSHDTTILQRIVRVHAGTINKDTMRTIYPDILALNRIKESSVVITIKQGPVGTSTGPLGRKKKR
jgi:hypothetical protein